MMPTTASVMSHRRRHRDRVRWLDWMSVACAAIAVVLLVLPSVGSLVAVQPDMSRPAGTMPATPATSAVPVISITPSPGDSLVALVVNGNVFSATRRAPRVRFVVPGQSTGDYSPMSGVAIPDSAMMGGPAVDALPRLTAIVAMNGERRALLQLTASDGAPRLYRINDVHAGYRIVRIESDHVVLASRAGTRTLRLAQRATPDTLENFP